MINKYSELIKNQNPWWQDPSFIPEEYLWIKRESFNSIQKLCQETPFIIALTGLRRVGKSTIQKQLIATLLKNKIEKERILYFSFEEQIFPKKTENLEFVIDFFLKKVLKKEIYEIKKTVYLFLDEVQFIPFWQVILKRYYDLNKNLKFIISGSSSLFIRSEAKESLAGRILEVKIPPLSFFEFLKFKKEKIDLTKTNLFSLEESLKEAQGKLLPNLEKTEGLFAEFLSEGEFPELLKFKDFSLKKQYLKDWVVDKVLEKDLPSVVKILAPEKLFNLANALFWQPAQMIQLVNLAQDQDLNRETLSLYLSYLEKSFLIKILENKTRSFRTKHKGLKKVYLTSGNFTTALRNLNYLNPNFSYLSGSLVENYVFNRLVAFIDKTSGNLYFFKERDKEIDFLISGDLNLAIEVKFQEKIKPQDLKTLINYSRKNHLQKALVLTKKDLGKIKIDKNLEIYKLPAFLI